MGYKCNPNPSYKITHVYVGIPKSFFICISSRMSQVSTLDLLVDTSGDLVNFNDDNDASQATKIYYLCGFPDSASNM